MARFTRGLRRNPVRVVPLVFLLGDLGLIVLMFVGRVGTITVASALALRATHRRYRCPEERSIVG